MSNHADEYEKFITLIGVGKLGLCFGLVLEQAGYSVYGVDVNKDYLKSIESKTLKSSEPHVEDLLSKSKNFYVTTNLEDAVEDSELVFCLVATPSLESGDYDHSQIDGVVESLLNMHRPHKQKHFVVCCTTMPGYCESIREKMAKHNYTVSYNPEFIAQGTIIQNQLKPDMVLIGEANKKVGDLLEAIYSSHTKNTPVVCRMSPTEAEITKLSLNCFLTTKIAYANMIGDIVINSGGNPNTVLNAIGSDSRIGKKYLGYGFGYGGPCFPRDNRALKIYADRINSPALISETTDKSNNLHLEQQLKHLKANPPKDGYVIVDFVTYKPESILLTESQQLKYALGAVELGYKVLIKDNRQEVMKQIKSLYGDLFYFY